MSDSRAGAVIVISSHVMRGSVGGRAAVFALETLGHRIWSVPTVMLPFHPGHGRSTRITIPDADFDHAIDDLIGSKWTGEVVAVLSGYFASPGQTRAVARLVGALRQANPDLVYVCDPVLGDNGGLYIPEPTAAAVRDHLVPIASLATPNRFELGWLCGGEVTTNTAVMDAALSLGPPRVLVTSALPMMAGGTGNLLLSGRNALLAEHRLVENPPNGTGDLLSAVFLSRLLSGMDEEQALQLATASVYEMIARSTKRGSDELTLTSDASSLSNPMALVQMRRLLHPAKRPVR
jgi:pyridoxine kinase